MVPVLFLGAAVFAIQRYGIGRHLTDFVFLGAVPGTDVVLAPDTVIILLSGIAALEVLTVIHYLYRQRRTVSYNAVVQQNARQHRRLPISRRRRLRAMQAVRPLTFSLRTRIAWMKLLSRWDDYRLSAADRTEKFFSRILPFIFLPVRLVIGVYLFVCRLLLWLRNAAARSVIAVWMSLDPKLRRFDSWLERRIKQTGDDLKRSAGRSEVLAFAVDTLAEGLRVGDYSRSKPSAQPVTAEREPTGK